MNRIAIGFLSLLVTCQFLRASGPVSNIVTYTLVDGSYFIDDCLVCGRPTIEQPLRGTFDLVLLQDTPPYTRYAIQNIHFIAGPRGSSLERSLTGSGVYIRFEEFGLLQDMNLALQVKDSYTNRPAYFTNETRATQQPFPLIQATLQQTNGTLLQTFTLQIFAAPVREIWFSTSKSFISTNPASSNKQITAGALLSTTGRVVKRNIDLVGKLGVMPIVADLGLDALDITQRGEILFSLPADVFSETLGPLQHGDLLSNRGVIVKRNQELLAAFRPPSSTDAGLDAVQRMPDKQILFSIQTNFVVNSTSTLSRGDILSDAGTIFITHQQLLAKFQPTVTNRDFGLDAFQVLPSGEIWFSVEEAFTDSRIGPVQSGDLLSNLGYRVFRNQSLLEAFSPADPAPDYGLDALFLITDTVPARPAPRITRQTVSGQTLHIEWDGEGYVFQLETTPTLSNSWFPCSEIIPDLFFDTPCDLSPGVSGFYRLRQW
jgi:hypothetical protein